jgi:hypothetical protein
MTLVNRHELTAGEPIGPLADALTEAEAIRARPGPRIPQNVIEAMMDADDEAHDAMAAALDGRASDDVPPDSVRVMWEAVQPR